MRACAAPAAQKIDNCRLDLAQTFTSCQKHSYGL